MYSNRIYISYTSLIYDSIFIKSFFLKWISVNNTQIIIITIEVTPEILAARILLFINPVIITDNIIEIMPPIININPKNLFLSFIVLFLSMGVNLNYIPTMKQIKPIE